VKHVLHIIVFFKFFQQLFYLRALFFVESLGFTWDAYELGRVDFKASLLEVGLDVGIGCKFSINKNIILIHKHFIHAIVNQIQLQIFQGDTFLSASGTHIYGQTKNSRLPVVPSEPPMFVEVAAYVGHGACRVVSGCLHHNGDAVGPISFVDHLPVVF